MSKRAIFSSCGELDPIFSARTGREIDFPPPPKKKTKKLADNLITAAFGGVKILHTFLQFYNMDLCIFNSRATAEC